MSGEADFWSRRKAAVAAETQAEQRIRDDADAASERAELEARSDAEILTGLNLPDPDTLEPGDDFSAFLQHAVPERLRRRALRRLWRSNPVLANLDELVDYGEDYTDAATVIEDLQTAYQVGRGMMKHVLEMTKADEGTSPDGDAAPVAGDGDDEAQIVDAGVATPPDTPEPEPASAMDAVPETAAASDLEPVAPARRRMRIGFSA